MELFGCLNSSSLTSSNQGDETWQQTKHQRAFEDFGVDIECCIAHPPPLSERIDPLRTFIICRVLDSKPGQADRVRLRRINAQPKQSRRTTKKLIDPCLVYWALCLRALCLAARQAIRTGGAHDDAAALRLHFNSATTHLTLEGMTTDQREIGLLRSGAPQA